MKYLIDNSRVINSDHIVQAVYDPEISGVDDEDGKPFHNQSRCVITLTSVHIEAHTVYDGDTDGCASESDTITLRGKWADKFWSAYAGDSYTV